MAPTDYQQSKTPGVYVTELDAFPPSIVGVQTSVPAFIGYTEKAETSGKSMFMQPIKISSLADFEAIFGTGFKPQFDIVAIDDPTAISNGDYCFQVQSADRHQYYDLIQTSFSEFNLYNSMRLFYANGGDNCYVVSVGDYTAQNSSPEGVIIDPKALAEGLDLIADQVGPTMLVVPDSVLLTNNGIDQKPWVSDGFQDVVRQMSKQCADLQDRVAILDVYGTQSVTEQNLTDVIDNFKTNVGSEFLNYGMAYFPFLDSTITQANEIDYTTISKQSIDTLITVLSNENTQLYGNTPRQLQVQNYIDAIDTTERTDNQAVTHLNQNLTAALPLLLDIEKMILHEINQLPACGAMAGVYTSVDNTKGVWNAPANITLNSVANPTFKLNNEQQGDLNVPLDGKAVNAIREFTGRGSVVWGARTLDGNSNDWRYIQVRRTLIYVEQSIKTALDPFVFAANDAKTWATVTSMVSNFLQGLWSQGGLMGATAAEAFTVECGLGSTMTGQDILDGYMIVQVTLQMIRPAEFIELTFKQKMEGTA